MKVNEKIDPNSFVVSHCLFQDMQGLVNAIRADSIVWSWGAHAWAKMNNYCLRFAVHGHHHAGHVYVVVNGNDLFDIYLTSNRGTIKKVLTNVYVEDFVATVDNAVERIAAYKS